MSAHETLIAAQSAGVRLSVDGQDLLVEADRAPSPSLLEALKRNKPEILTLLSGWDEVGIAPGNSTNDGPNLLGLTLAELKDAAGEDWPEARDDREVLEALAHAVVTRRQRECGERPPHWTEHSECAGCGPVFLWPGNPTKVLGCPWCFNRAAGRPIARPMAVTCGTCRHFCRTHHPHLGHCAVGEPEAVAGLCDTDRRECGRWLPKSPDVEAPSDGE